MGLPRLMIASLRGGSGKTIVTMGILAAWKARGVRVVPFKKGPDYIDAGWLAKAAGHPCFNLDPFLMGRKRVLRSFRQKAGGLSVIEGNRGLFDGIDPRGTYSSAELAKTLQCPLILVVDCTKTTGTTAALVLGCRTFDPALDLRGVILNNLAGSRHERVTRKAVEQYGGLPVLGAIPRNPTSTFPERHLGLLPVPEHPEALSALRATRMMAEKYLDLDGLWSVAHSAMEMTPCRSRQKDAGYDRAVVTPSRIGVVEDRAFQFYYPENLEALEKVGAKLIYLNALNGSFPNDLDGLYIGGGFPETQALMLTRNRPFKQALKAAVEEGLPVYAECGGLMYLGKELVYQGQTYPMVGVFPLTFALEKRPQGHGYTQIRVTGRNPFFSVGTRLRGHEFHYSRVKEEQVKTISPVFEVLKGKGLDGKGDGLVYKNVLAAYTHLHALGTPEWAPALVAKAVEFGRSRKRKRADRSRKAGM